LSAFGRLKPTRHSALDVRVRIQYKTDIFSSEDSDNRRRGNSVSPRLLQHFLRIPPVSFYFFLSYFFSTSFLPYLFVSWFFLAMRSSSSFSFHPVNFSELAIDSFVLDAFICKSAAYTRCCNYALFRANIHSNCRDSAVLFYNCNIINRTF